MNKKIELIKAIALLPGMALIVIPGIILYFTHPAGFLWNLGFPKNMLPLGAGFLFVIVGVIFALKTVMLFFTAGDGTPAPWAPPKYFVVQGPYCYVRNPMLLSALGILIGEAVLFGSFALLIWCIVFWVINTFYFIRFEEPGLAKRFGTKYLEYKKHVRRWLPRITPWDNPDK